MIISFKTDGTDNAVDIVNAWLEGTSSTGIATQAEANGRIKFKKAMVGDDLVLTSEWSITREEYDALGCGDHSEPMYDGTILPLLETDDHLDLD